MRAATFGRVWSLFFAADGVALSTLQGILRKSTRWGGPRAAGVTVREESLRGGVGKGRLPGGSKTPTSRDMCSTGRAPCVPESRSPAEAEAGEDPCAPARRASSCRQGSDRAPRLRSAPRGPECPEQLGPAVLQGPRAGVGLPRGSRRSFGAERLQGAHLGSRVTSVRAPRTVLSESRDQNRERNTAAGSHLAETECRGFEHGEGTGTVPEEGGG